MDSYKIDTSNEGGPIPLGDGNGELNPPDGGDAVPEPEDQIKLSEILKALNDAFGTDFTDEDSVFIKQITARLLSDENLRNKVKNNPKENVEAIFGGLVEDILVELFNNNEDFFNKIHSNHELKEKLERSLLDYVYEKLGE